LNKNTRDSKSNRKTKKEKEETSKLRQDRQIRRQRKYILINTKSDRLKHWKEEVKTENPEQLDPPISLSYKSRMI
jgi:hypothetical protein